MEKRYIVPRAKSFFSAQINFDDYFNEFGKLIAESYPDVGVHRILGLSDDNVDELNYMEIITDNLHQAKIVREDGFPSRDGFTHDVDRIPDSVTNLKSLEILRKRTESQVRILRKKLSYPGQVDLEDFLSEQKPSLENVIDLAPCAFYVVQLRIYLPVAHSKYTSAVRAREFQVSQELLCLSSTGIDALRDRIACSNDLQPADGDISADPSRRTQVRTGDLHKSAMFYFGNDFYVDTRHPDNWDYSKPIMEWGRTEGFEFGNVCKMEQCTISDLKSIRLGYPYVYIHQGTCEHLVVFTDARLLHISDCMDSSKYPTMVAFASLNIRYCFSCHVTLAKYLVVDCNRLPEDAVFMCTACLKSYNYKGGQKIGRFRLYSYVDRSALF